MAAILILFASESHKSYPIRILVQFLETEGLNTNGATKQKAYMYEITTVFLNPTLFSLFPVKMFDLFHIPDPPRCSVYI